MLLISLTQEDLGKVSSGKTSRPGEAYKRGSETVETVTSLGTSSADSSLLVSDLLSLLSTSPDKGA